MKLLSKDFIYDIMCLWSSKDSFLLVIIMFKLRKVTF